MEDKWLALVIAVFIAAWPVYYIDKNHTNSGVKKQIVQSCATVPNPDKCADSLIKRINKLN